MCGFVGFTDRRLAEDKKKILHPMMDRIVHRGPDMAGDFADDEAALGFRRLSIIDLSEAGAQPMLNEDGTLAMVFNGEIYNFKELRTQLEALGHSFKSHADSEVLLHGYEEWGESIVNKLRGMFAFALWDQKTASLFMARDFFGIKPFYYADLLGGGFVFGSEIKSFLDHPDFVKEVNPNALRAYLGFQYAAGRETFFKGVYSLLPGHYAVWQNGKLEITKYYDIEFNADENLSFEECAEIIDETVRESVEVHRVGDVEVGAFLSGGVDSSYITACLKPEKTFSVGFKQEKFDETSYAQELSEQLGVENFRRHLTADECFAAFADIQYHMDQPQSNPSSVPLWFLAQLAREEVKVVLSGEGADEMFAGYELYADTPTMKKYKKLPLGLRRMLGGIAKAMPAFKGRNFLLKSAERPENWFIGQADVFSDKEALKILNPQYKNGPSALEMAAPYYAQAAENAEVTKKQYLDMHLWLPGDILLKADKMCMAHSLELRVPLLDKEIMALAERVPSRYTIDGTESKKVFRHAANRILPNEWATRPKKGFPVPIRLWLREEKYFNIVKEYFESDFAAEFFNTAKIMKLLCSHYEGRANNARKIWTVYTFLVWYKRFFVDEKTAL